MEVASFLQIFLSGGAAGGIAATLVLGFWKSYWTKKAENLATKQDIGEITRAVEQVKQEYALSLEKVKSGFLFQSVQRERAEQVAELLVEWVSRPKDRRRLNVLLIKVTMWLPDNEAKEVNNLLAYDPSTSLRSVICSVRRLIQGANVKLTPDDITFFPMSVNQDNSNLDPQTLASVVAELNALYSDTSKKNKQSQ